MDIIIGGACQGKLQYARDAFQITDDDIFECTEAAAPDASRRCIYHYERYVLHCIRAGNEEYKNLRGDAIVIADDIFCGVVPIDEEVRLWREETGRALTALALQADSVTRLFCGIARRLK